MSLATAKQAFAALSAPDKAAFLAWTSSASSSNPLPAASAPASSTTSTNLVVRDVFAHDPWVQGHPDETRILQVAYRLEKKALEKETKLKEEIEAKKLHAKCLKRAMKYQDEYEERLTGGLKKGKRYGHTFGNKGNPIVVKVESFEPPKVNVAVARTGERKTVAQSQLVELEGEDYADLD